ncbi:MAG: MBL fold metallo-hydrolase [Pyrobaculum sp.]
MEVITKYLAGAPLVTTYVLNVGGVKFVVDPGPASLYSPLEVDAVVCTHLHLDHCGSAGHFQKPVYAHERYIKHVLDPSRLYESSRAVLGVFAEMFGPPAPASEVKSVKDGALVLDALEAIHTPGHAPHHVMYYYKDKAVLFVGDGAGVYIPELDVIIPTTPPPFKLDLYLQSLDRLRGLSIDTLCFPHYSCTRKVELLKQHQEQVKTWVETLRDRLDMPLDDALYLLTKSDENVAKVVEKGGLYLEFYLKFSVVGFLEYLKTASTLK